MTFRSEWFYVILKHRTSYCEVTKHAMSINVLVMALIVDMVGGGGGFDPFKKSG